MAEFQYVIKDSIGIHARPAGALVKLAKDTGSVITLTKGDTTVECTRLMALMGLGVKQNDKVTVASEDAEALALVQKFFEENL